MIQILSLFRGEVCMTASMTREELVRPERLLLPETWNTELVGRPRSALDWVWPGYLARGAVTLLTSQWKTGKTTLVSALIARMARGGELAGLTVRPARVAIASEETLDCWQRRGEKLHFG